LETRVALKSPVEIPQRWRCINLRLFGTGPEVAAPDRGTQKETGTNLEHQRKTTDLRRNGIHKLFTIPLGWHQGHFYSMVYFEHGFRKTGWPVLEAVTDLA
jgi:hypothetical protein